MTDLLEQLTTDFLRDDAGSPLGIGMPSGSPLRADGQSHYEAWQALLRRDPCSYCAAAGACGTVDHVEPRSRSARGIGTVHGWLNLAGACGRCNGAKRDVGLLMFLHNMRWGSRRQRPGRPVRAQRQSARRRPREAAAHRRVGRARSRARVG
jgi:5-methylcytosine-specific restriction endonuclease McrA